MPRTVDWDTSAVNENTGGSPTYAFERGAPDIQEYKTIMQDNLNEYFGIMARSLWMYRNKGISYDGVKYAKVPKIEVAGLGDYRRNQGYALSAANLTYEQFEVRMDRSSRISVDRLDLDETGGLTSIVNMARRQMDERIIPEIDAYNYSSVFAKVEKDYPSNISTTDVNAKDLLDELRLTRAKLENEFSVPDLAYFMTPITASYLASNFEKVITYQDFEKGSIFTKVKAIDGVPIIEVPGLRFHTAYEFGEGTTDPNAVDLDDLGFKVANDGTDDAPEMLYMVAPLSSTQAFTKLNVTKLKTPETSDIDSYELAQRIVYDCWIRKENSEMVKINTGELKVD